MTTSDWCYEVLWGVFCVLTNMRTESPYNRPYCFPLIHTGFPLQWFSLERYSTVDNILSNILAPYITITPRQLKYSGRHRVSKTRCSQYTTANWALLNKLLILWANKRPSRDSKQVFRGRAIQNAYHQLSNTVKTFATN